MTAGRRPPRCRGIAPLALLLTLVTRPADAQDDTLRLAAEPLAGCFTVRLGAWSKPLGRNEPLHTPPDKVLLDTVLVDGPLGRPGFRLTPHVPALTRYRTIPARWWRVSADSVRASWTSGFAGVALHLGRAGPDLEGRAVAFSDVIPVERLPDGSYRQLPWPEARVSLRRIPCP